MKESHIKTINLGRGEGEVVIRPSLQVASLYLMTVPVFELPGTPSNMYFVHVNLMNNVEHTKIQKCKKNRLDLLIYCKNSPELLYLLYLRLELSGHLNKLLNTPMPS